MVTTPSNNQQVLAAQRVRAWLAPVGTPAPATATSVPPTGWRNVGLTKPDSLAFSTSPEFEDVPSHQSDYPARTLQTGETATLAVDLLQWNSANMKSAYGGGDVVETAAGSGTYKFTPPRLGKRIELTAMIEVFDGDKAYRWMFARVSQREGVEAALNKGASTGLPLRFSVLGDDDVDPWYLLTNDPAFAPAA